MNPNSQRDAFDAWWDREGRDIFQRFDGWKVAIAAWQAALSGGPEGDGWIPVSERLPSPLSRTVVGLVTLVADVYGRVTWAEWDTSPVDGKMTCRWPRVTHWRPLPAAPKSCATEDEGK